VAVRGAVPFLVDWKGEGRWRPPERGPIRASEATEDIPLSGRERAEGFLFSVSAAVAVSVTVTHSERPEGFLFSVSAAVAVSVTVTRSERPEGFPFSVSAAVAVSVTVTHSERPEGFRRSGSVAVTLTVNEPTEDSRRACKALHDTN